MQWLCRVGLRWIWRKKKKEQFEVVQLLRENGAKTSEELKAEGK